MRNKRFIWIIAFVVLGLTAAGYGLFAKPAGREYSQRQKPGGQTEKMVDLALAWVEDVNLLLPRVECGDEKEGRAAIVRAAPKLKKPAADGKGLSLRVAVPGRKGGDANTLLGELRTQDKKNLRRSRLRNENILNRIDVKATRMRAGSGDDGQIVKTIGLFVLLPPAFWGLVLASRFVLRR